MVEVYVADDNGIYLSKGKASGLLSEIWTTVNKHTDTSVSLEKGRLAQTLVASFRAATYLTLATYSRHAY
jgi:hypothetical protein